MNKIKNVRGIKIGWDDEYDTPILIEDYKGQAFIVANTRNDEIRQASINRLFRQQKDLHEALHDAMLYEYSDYPTGFKTADDFIKNTCGFCEEDPQ